MKATGGLFPEIATHQNLAAAVWRAAQGKRRRREVCAWIDDLDQNLAELSAKLRSGAFRFSPYRSFRIRDPKTRVIHAPPFGDRVVHHALIGVTGPVFEKGGFEHSYACRKGKGQHAALEQVRQWLQPDSWFLKMDVVKFYDSIRHDDLLRQLHRRFREKRLLALWECLLGSYETAPGLGLPIGALTSQYLGNFVLDPMDRVIQNTANVRHCRYMDDFLVVGDRASLLRARSAAEIALARIGLAIKHHGVINQARFGAPFLGFTLYPDRSRLNAAGRQRLRRRCRELSRNLRREARPATPAEMDSLRSQFAHAAWSSDRNWRLARCRELESIWERQGLASGQPGRLLEQFSQELPFSDPQQEPSGQSQQESGLPPMLVLRHGGDVPPPDDAFSSALAETAGDKSLGQRPASPDNCDRTVMEKGTPPALAETFADSKHHEK